MVAEVKRAFADHIPYIQQNEVAFAYSVNKRYEDSRSDAPVFHHPCKCDNEQYKFASVSNHSELNDKSFAESSKSNIVIIELIQ